MQLRIQGAITTLASNPLPPVAKKLVGRDTYRLRVSDYRIVYSIQPQHLIDRPGSTLRERCMDYGHQMAVCNAGQWYRPGMREPIIDARTIALLERVPNA